MTRPKLLNPLLSLGFATILGCGLPVPAGRADTIWIEGEKPSSTTVTRHPFWYDKVHRDRFSGADFLSHWNNTTAGEASYRFQARQAGSYELWIRANPVQSTMSYRLNGAKNWTPIELASNGRDVTNVAEDDKPDLRFLAWFRIGRVPLAKGANTITFRFDSENHFHGYLDCFVFSTEAIQPRGKTRPEELEAEAQREAQAESGWFAFDPKADPFDPASPINLRSLNEKTAGDGGPIAVKDGHFVHSKTGEPVRFWAVNGPSRNDRIPLADQARVLAKRGVNLVRLHGSLYDAQTGTLDPKLVQSTIDAVAAFKAEGIYSHLSIYFPLWLTPKPGLPWLEGYDGKTHPFAALEFNPEFQAHYRAWWKALLTTPDARTGKRLVDDPALMGLEIQNEDSYFFWTFKDDAIPDAQMRILEAQFGAWLKQKYGSISRAVAAWGGGSLPRDRPNEGRMAFRPLWNMANERTKRDQDTARFLTENQRAFYQQSYDFLRSLGFQGVITASNWTTADPVRLGPLERYTYSPTDFIDRHGYYGGVLKGDNAAWSIRNDQTFSHRSGYRFEAEAPGKPRLFNHPAFDIHYDGKPSMISETTWPRPNRYRGEAPLFYAAYGAIQDSDAIVHFALDGAEWSAKPNFFMQPWTVMAPTQMGQFPAAALLYRKGLVSPGDQLVDLNLKIGDLLDLKGTPLPQDASLDELRLADVPAGGAAALKEGARINPLVHLMGRTNTRFTEKGGPAKVVDFARYLDTKAQTVSSTNGQVKLDYGKGVLTIDAPAVQSAGGNLKAAGPIRLKNLTVESNMDQIHVVAVALDDAPLASSKKILLQVMTEEQPTGFRSEPAGTGLYRILDIGRDPWRVRRIEGSTVRLDSTTAKSLKVAALDPNGTPIKTLPGDATAITLEPDIIYYLLAP